jgi:hypothetical protein
MQCAFRDLALLALSLLISSPDRITLLRGKLTQYTAMAAM